MTGAVETKWSQIVTENPNQGKVDPEFEQYYREVEAALGRSTGGDSESQK